MKITYFITAVLCLFSFSNSYSIADEFIDNKSVKVKKEKEKKYWGTISGSFETNTTYYVDDEKTGAIAPKDNYGSNNYFKVDYTYKGLTVGVQAEWYPQVLQGYDEGFTGFALPIKYASWQNDFMSVTIGDFYDQFGSGLILRSWEDRALGFNNSLLGGRMSFNIKNKVRIKALSGIVRDYMKYSSTLVSGLDVSASLSEIFKMDNHLLSVEASAVSRYETEFREDFSIYDFEMPKNVMTYSGRVNYEHSGFLAKYEYVHKGNDYFFNSFDVSETLQKGQAHLLELGYSGDGLSILSMFRYLDKMMSPAYRELTSDVFTSNTINYIPALTQQHTYSLTSLEPYPTIGDGEVGGQLDVFYRVKRGTALGGKRGMKIHANFSLYYALPDVTFSGKTLFKYGDLTFDIEKNWTKKFQSTILVSLQKYNKGYQDVGTVETRTAFVLDMTYKFSRKYSLRAELQYLLAPDTKEKDWMAAQLEFNVAPKWGVFVTDMYNHGGSKNHFFSGGMSYTHSIVRAALSYGRYREGFICSGGVCRSTPAYTGLNLSVVVSF